MSLGLGALVAFLLPGAGALNSRLHAPDLAPQEGSGAQLYVIVATIAISLVTALVIYLGRRYLLLKNDKGDRGWDAFTLFLFLAVVGSALARTGPLPGM